MTGTLYGAASAKGWQLRLDYATTEDAAANSSTVTAALYVYDATGTSYNQTPGEAWYQICGGGQVAQPYSFSAADWYHLGSRTFTAAHASDGSGTVTLTGDWCSGIDTSAYTPYALSVSGTVTLPVIPRASGVSCGSFTLGAAGSIVISAASDGFTHTVTYTFGGASGTVASGVKGGTLSWTPPVALCAQLPNSAFGSGKITCTTYSGGSAVGSASCAFTGYVPPAVTPVISAFTVSPVNTLSALAGVYVKGFTRVAYSVTAAGQYGASVTGCTVSFGGASGTGGSGTTGAVTAAGTVTPTVTARDSRGRTAVKTLPAVTVYDYAPPTVSGFSVRRCAADGTLSDTGTYLRVAYQAACSPVGGRCTAAVRARYKVAGGSYGGYTALSASPAVVGGDAAVDRSYVLELSVTDTLGGSRTVEETISTSAVTVNVRDGGKGMGVGKYAESDGLLDVAWSQRVQGNLTVTGGATVDSGVLSVGVGGIISAGDNALISHGNEFNFILDAFNKDVYVNYRTRSGTQNGAVGKYLFCRGAGSTVADIVCGTVYTRGSHIETFVEEEGTSGIWTYRKYSDGTRECWGTWSGSLSSSGAWSGFSGTYLATIAFPTGLFTAVPAVQISAQVTTGVSVVGYIRPSAAQVAVETLSNNTGTQTCTVYVTASGR